MKPNTILFIVLAGTLFMNRPDADAQVAIIDWQGTGGYSARIVMAYDASFNFVSALGGGPFGGTPTNQGINSLSVDFFLPSSSTPVYSTQDISNGAVTYKFLALSLDTVSRNLTGSLDVGRDSFAEGDPGSSLGQYYLLGVSSPSLINSATGQQVDSGGQFFVTVVPEPSSLTIGAIGFAIFVTAARRFRPRSFA